MEIIITATFRFINWIVKGRNWNMNREFVHKRDLVLRLAFALRLPLKIENSVSFNFCISPAPAPQRIP